MVQVLHGELDFGSHTDVHADMSDCDIMLTFKTVAVISWSSSVRCVRCSCEHTSNNGSYSDSSQ